MLRAAATDLKEPIPVTYPEARPSPYLEYALRLDRKVWSRWVSGTLVAHSLASMGEEGRRALVEWATNPAAHLSHRIAAYERLAVNPQPTDLPAFKALLAEPSLRYAVPAIGIFNYGPLERVIKLMARANRHAELLIHLAKMDAPEARALLFEYANDRSLTEPDPKVLDALSCPPSGRSEVEARALASLRLWAVSLLDDPELWRKIADDKTEPLWFRAWMRRLIEGKPLVPRDKPAQWRRVVNRISSPCLWVE